MNNLALILQILDDSEGRKVNLRVIRSEFWLRAGKEISEGDAKAALKEAGRKGWVTQGENAFGDVTWTITAKGQEVALSE